MKTLLEILDDTVNEVQEEFAFLPGPSFELLFFLPPQYYHKIEKEILEKAKYFSIYDSTASLTDLKYSTNGATCSIQLTDHSKTNDITNKFINKLIEAIMRDEYV